MPVVIESEAWRHQCPWNEFKSCQGAKCMAWGWAEPGFERAETDNLCETAEGQRPSGEAPPMPEGEGWERDGAEFSKGYHQSAKLNLPKARAQAWVRRIPQQHGYCQRAGDDDCRIPL